MKVSHFIAAALFLFLAVFFLSGSGFAQEKRIKPPVSILLQGRTTEGPSRARPGGTYCYLSRWADHGKGRLAAAIEGIGPEPAVLFLDIDDALGGNTIVPDNIRIVHLGAAKIDLGGYDLEIAGTFAAGPDQVFEGAGGVSFSPGGTARVLPQWWGDDTSGSVQKALDAAVGCGAELYLPAGEYVFTESVSYAFSYGALDIHGLTISGDGPGHTVIDNRTAGQPAFRFGTVTPSTDWSWFVTIGGMEIESTTGTGGHGIEVADIWNGRIHDCFIHDLAGDGILMRAGEIDLGLCKTWMIEQSVIFYNEGYGIELQGVDYKDLSFDVVMDRLDVEANNAGGIFAAAEGARLSNSIIAYNGAGATDHGGIHITGVAGYWVHDNIVSGNGFEGNFPYDIYVDRALNTSIEKNTFARVEQGGLIKPDNFILLGNPNSVPNRGAINVEIRLNRFGSGHPSSPFTAIVGSPGLVNADLDDNVFDIQTTDEAYAFDTDTKVTLRSYGDTVYANQTVAFAPPGMGAADTFIERGGPGILKVTGGVAEAIQDVPSIGGMLSIDCSKGLNVLHTLSENTTVMLPSNATAGVHLNLIVFQAPGKAYTIAFHPAFKLAESFTVSALHFSTIRFVYTGLYWIQMGGAAIDAPL